VLPAKRASSASTRATAAHHRHQARSVRIKPAGGARRSSLRGGRNPRGQPELVPCSPTPAIRGHDLDEAKRPRPERAEEARAKAKDKQEVATVEASWRPLARSSQPSASSAKENKREAANKKNARVCCSEADPSTTSGRLFSFPSPLLKEGCPRSGRGVFSPLLS